MASRAVLPTSKRVYSASVSDLRTFSRPLLTSQPPPDLIDALLYRWTLLRDDLTSHDFALIFKTISKWRIPLKPDILSAFSQSVLLRASEFSAPDAGIAICALSRLPAPPAAVLDALLPAFLANLSSLAPALQVQTLLALAALRSPKFPEIRAKIAATLDVKRLDPRAASLLVSLVMRPISTTTLTTTPTTLTTTEGFDEEPLEEVQVACAEFASDLFRRCVETLPQMKPLDMVYLAEALSRKSEVGVSGQKPYYFRLREILPIFSNQEISRLLRFFSPYVFSDFRFPIIFEELSFRLGSASGPLLVEWLECLSEWAEFFASHSLAGQTVLASSVAGTGEIVELANKMIEGIGKKRKSLQVSDVVSYIVSVRNFRSVKFPIEARKTLHALFEVLQRGEISDQLMASEIFGGCVELRVRDTHLVHFGRRVGNLSESFLLTAARLDLAGLVDEISADERNLDHMYALAILALNRKISDLPKTSFPLRSLSKADKAKLFLYHVAVGNFPENFRTCHDVFARLAGLSDFPEFPTSLISGWEYFSAVSGGVSAVDLPMLAVHLESPAASPAGGPVDPVTRDRGVLLVAVDEWWRSENLKSARMRAADDLVLPEHRALVVALRRCGWRVVEVKQDDDQLSLLNKIAELH